MDSGRWTSASSILAIALLGSLACNHAAWPAGALILATALLAAVVMGRDRRVPREAWLLLIPLAWWTLSFALTRESWSVFFSPAFLRRDGSLLVSLIPLAALATLPLDRNRIEGALRIYLVFQALVALLGAATALGGWESAFFHPAAVVDQQPTFFGLYVAHNATASVYLLLTIGALAWAAKHGGERFPWIPPALAALLGVGCVLARSRGAFIGLVIAAAFVTFRAVRSRTSGRAMAAVWAALLLAMLAGSGLLLPRFQRMAEEGSDNFRRQLWSRAWDNFAMSPAVGVGFGRYNDKDLEFSSIGIGQVATRGTVVNDDRHAHNSYLHWLAEGGAIGLAVMVAFWIFVARSLKGDDWMREWILGGIVAMAALSATEHYAGGGIFLTHLAFLIGIRQSREVPA